MDPKYSNIFWHQGVKVFEGNILNSHQGQIKVAHLENDVTKALLNLFEHSSPKVFKSFLNMNGVKQSPEAFRYEFQVTDTDSFRRKAIRIMLCIISTSTNQKTTTGYETLQSIPDACIHSKDTAILIESKTQSPLVPEQIQSHIKHYLGTATRERTITWEDISEKLRLLSGELKGQDLFLVDQFRGFLDLIGISKFNGFSDIDFEMLGALGKLPDEDFADFKRLFHRKADQFMALLEKEITPAYSFKPFKIYMSRLIPDTIGTFSGLSFFDDDPNLHNNHYPNININYLDHCVELTFNAETRSSVKFVFSCIKSRSGEMDQILKKMPKLLLKVYYKIQYQPMDHFIWNLVPGFPKRFGTFSSAIVKTEIDTFQNRWEDFRTTVIYQMASGDLRHSSGRMFNEQEISFARERNPRPNYAIRFGQQYPVYQIPKKKNEVVRFFKNEIIKLKPLVELVLGS